MRVPLKGHIRAVGGGEKSNLVWVKKGNIRGNEYEVEQEQRESITEAFDKGSDQTRPATRLAELPASGSKRSGAGRGCPTPCAHLPPPYSLLCRTIWLLHPLL